MKSSHCQRTTRQSTTIFCALLTRNAPISSPPMSNHSACLPTLDGPQQRKYSTRARESSTLHAGLATIKFQTENQMRSRTSALFVRDDFLCFPQCFPHTRLTSPIRSSQTSRISRSVTLFNDGSLGQNSRSCLF